MACKYYINNKVLNEQEIKEYISSNYIKESDIKLTTLGDIADILAYSNSKLILPGYEVEYTTPDNMKFKTYAEASRHISQLSKSIEDVDLSNVKIQNNQGVVTSSSEIPVNEFSPTGYDHDIFRKDPVTGEWVRGDYDTPAPENDVVQFYNMYMKYATLDGFIEKNKEYEQSKGIIEEWKKVNNIVYNPEEIYSRGQEFVSVVGAYSSFDVNLMMQNLLTHIEDNEKAGGKFAISAFTKPINRQIDHLEGGGGKIKFKIYPQSEDILWAANADVYSGSVSDASLRVNKNKKSELLGVTYTKYPSLNYVSFVQPNLASIIDDLDHHHNELGIVLTGNNFRLEYDKDIPYQTKKIIDGINGILDSKYGKLVKPNINIRKPITKKSAYIRQVDSENNIIEFIVPEFDDKGKLLYANRITHQNNKYYFEPEFASSFGRPDETLEITKEEFDSLIEKYKDQLQPLINEVKPLVTKENLKESIESTKDKIEQEEDWDGTITPESEARKIEMRQKYTSQALINTKIAKLKEVSKKYPRSLIRSEVVPVNRNYVNSYRQFDDELPFQLIPTTNKEVTPELYQSLINFVKKVNPDFRVEVVDDLLASKGVNGLIDFKNFLIQLQNGKQSALPEEVAHVFFELMEDSNPLKQRMLDEITNTRIYKQVVKEYREVYGNDTKKLKGEAAAKLISLWLSDKTLARKMSGSDSLWENIQRWMANFIKWIKGRPKTFSSFIESAERIVNLDTSGLNLDRAYQLEEMYSLADYVEKIKILESVRNTNVSNTDRIYFNLNDTLFDYKNYPGSSAEKRAFLFDTAQSQKRDNYYQTVKLTSLGRELADKSRFIGSDKITIYTQMFVSPALESRIRSEFGQNVRIERINVTEIIEDADGNIISERETNSLQEVLDRDGERRLLIVDNGKPSLTKPYNIVQYNSRKSEYVTLEERDRRERERESRNKVTEKFLDELERVNETKEGSVTRLVGDTFELIRRELNDIERTERILSDMGEEEVSKLFRDQYGNLGLPIKSADAAKKLIEETDKYRDALLQFYSTIEGTIGFFKERNDNEYQATKDLINKGDIDSMEKAIYELSKITKIGTSWQEYIKDFRQLIKDIPNTQTVDSLLGELDTQITRTKDIAHDLNIKVLSERLSNEFAAYNWTKESRFKEVQEKMEASTDPLEKAKYQKELDTLKTKGVEDVSRILMGETPDIDSLTVWIKTLYNSNDPLIGSVSKLLQKAFAQVESRELQRGQEMGINIKEIKDKYNLSEKDLEELLVVEKTPVFNPANGEYELKDRWAYLNPWQNRHEYDEMKKPFLESYDKFKAAKQNKDENLEQIRKEYLVERKKFEDWETENWHRVYTEEYYKRYDELRNENPELFEQLKVESDLIWSDINSKSLLLRGETNPENRKLLNQEIRDLRRQWSQVKSDVYFDGSAKTGSDLEMARMARRKSEIDNEMHEWSIDNKTFEQDFTIFLNTLSVEDSLRETYLSLLNNKDNYSELYSELKKTAPHELIDWMEENTNIRYSQEWYDARSEITEKISEVSNKLAAAYGQAENIDLKETWESLINISSPYRDEDKVLDGSVTSPQVQEKILEYEQKIENIKKLVREEREGLYSSEIKALKRQLSDLINQLNEIQNKQVTDAYSDTFVELAHASNIVEEFNRLHPNLYFNYNSNLEVLINTNEWNEFLKDKDNAFTQWYHRNHLIKSYKDAFGEERSSITPTYLWMKIEPSDSKFVLTVPSAKYSQRVVKPEFQTVKENWVTWNPITYRWLPKSQKYFNPAYRKLQNSQNSRDIGLYQALRTLTDYHLKTQETAPKEARLEFGIPYVKKRGFEASGQYLKNMYNEFIDKNNRFEEGEGNFDETVEPESPKGIKNKLISWINGWIGEKEQDKEDTSRISRYTRIAVPYSHYAELENVSKDIVFTTTMFGFSTAKSTKMLHTLPTFRLLEDVLQNTQITKDSKGRPVSNNVNRLKAVQFAQDHYIYGVNKQYELGKNGKYIDRALTVIRKANTWGSLGWPFGIANTLKNNLQGRLQNLIGGKFGDWSSNSSMRKAAANMNTNFFKYLTEVENPEKRGLDYQIITWFNPGGMNNISEVIHKGGSKRIMQDRHIMIMNESMEFAISTNLLYGHLYHVKVKKGDEIKDLHSILRFDGTLKAEEGWVDYKTGRPVDEDYLIDTKLAFKTAAEYVQGKIADKTLLGTYTIGQALLYFKNWLIPMIRRRFDSKKENYMIGEDIEGYWKTFLRLNLTMMRDLMRDGKMYWHTFTPEEKRNYITTLNEVAFVVISSLLIGLVYGFDADDPDKYKKLKENSYAENLTLLIALQAKAETEMLTVMPFWNVESQVIPPVLTELPKIIMNPTIGFSIVNDLWKTINAGYGQITGDESAYYDRNMPAYNIEKGDSKFIHYGMKVFQIDNIVYSLDNPEGKLQTMIGMMKR